MSEEECRKCAAKGEDCGEHVPTWEELVDNWKQRAAEAEARGYRRGVESAVECIEDFDIDWTQDIEGNRNQIAFAVFRLVEPNSNTNRPHPENGTGLKSET